MDSPWGPFMAPEERGAGRHLPQRARHLGAQLQRALAGLARDGIPPGFRWSRVLSPLIWLSLPRYREVILRDVLRGLQLDDHALFAVARLWEAAGVHEASQVRRWMRRRIAGLSAAADQLLAEGP
eukprot:3893597-Alexandrium_andersonii.AAC.1